MTHKIIVTDNNQVECYAENQNFPHLRQPCWPDRTPWANKEEASLWANLYTVYENDNSQPRPPISPGVLGDSSRCYTPEQNIAIQRVRVLINNAKSLLEKKQIILEQGPALALLLGFPEDTPQKIANYYKD